MIELTSMEDKTVFIDPFSIESVIQEEDCSIVVTSSGNMHVVKEAASFIYFEKKKYEE